MSSEMPPHPSQPRLLVSVRGRFRVVLWVSAGLLVLSSLILALTCLIFPPTTNDAGRQWGLVLPHHDDTLLGLTTDISYLATRVANLFVHPSNDELSFDTPQPSRSRESEEEARLQMTLNHHDRRRRLKRIEPNLEREQKAARARARNMKPSSVKKDYVPLPNNFNDDPEILIFPNPEAENQYYQATNSFQDILQRQLLDPLGEYQQQLAISSGRSGKQQKRVPFVPQVQYLGVLVDAGRHYFPVNWLKILIQYLYRLRFNLLHLRLTDDQSFNVKLESHPNLAFPSAALTIHANETLKQGVSNDDRRGNSHPDNNQRYEINISKNDKVYTPEELRDLVQFAKQYNITIIPEINLPSHAGAWAGVSDLVINCPEFVCSRGYGLPLNVEHPQLKSILKDVIGEVLNIFNNPPLLHLGGDEVEMSEECFKEVGKKPFNYTKFEVDLREVLEELEYPEDQVIRWEDDHLPTLQESAHPKPPRTGKIEHFWVKKPKTKGKLCKGTKKAFFVSTGLYMDTNHESGAGAIFNETVDDLGIDAGPNYFPTGIVAGTFELSTDFWIQRNVASRLIAVAMGASSLNFSSAYEFWEIYNKTCRETMGLDAIVCDLQGYVAVTKSRYQRDWSKTWVNWTQAICDRMTEPRSKLVLSRIEANNRTNFDDANKHFWGTFKQPLSKRAAIVRRGDKAEEATDSSRRKTTTTGVLLDLVNGMRPTLQTADLLKKYVAPLGIGLAQLRLCDNNAFAVDLERTSRIGFSPIANLNNPVPTAQDFRSLVQAASELGIELYPEITLSSSAGGWLHSGFALNCPQVFCKASSTQRNLATEISKKEFLPLVYSVVRELMDVFSTSRYIHLGSDERRSSLACFQEDGRYRNPPFERYEKDVTKLLQEYIGMSTEHVLRWENEEEIRYPGRTGDITHYPSTTPFVLPKVREGEPFFVTLDVLAPMPSSASSSVFYEIYKNTRQLMALEPLGILAEIRVLDEATWFIYYVGLRLISFQLGTRNRRNEYSPKEFEIELVKECRRFQFPHCEEVAEGKVMIPPEGPTYYVETKGFRKKICDKKTEMKITRHARTTNE